MGWKLGNQIDYSIYIDPTETAHTVKEEIEVTVSGCGGNKSLMQ